MISFTRNETTVKGSVLNLRQSSGNDLYGLSKHKPVLLQMFVDVANIDFFIIKKVFICRLFFWIWQHRA